MFLFDSNIAEKVTSLTEHTASRLRTKALCWRRSESNFEIVIYDLNKFIWKQLRNDYRVVSICLFEHTELCRLDWGRLSMQFFHVPAPNNLAFIAGSLKKVIWKGFENLF